jgi:hypothetical protein
MDLHGRVHQFSINKHAVVVFAIVLEVTLLYCSFLLHE